MQTVVYLGLGGNVGDAKPVLKNAFELIRLIPFVSDLKCSSFYRTSPVSPIPQQDFINAACRFKTSLSPRQLQVELQSIERRLGKLPKAKEAPRPIDIDILFYGTEAVKDAELEIPHPRWRERLFVLKPLFDLCSEVALPGGETVCLKSYLKNFTNPYNETVEIDE